MISTFPLLFYFGNLWSLKISSLFLSILVGHFMHAHLKLFSINCAPSIHSLWMRTDVCACGYRLSASPTALDTLPMPLLCYCFRLVLKKRLRLPTTSWGNAPGVCVVIMLCCDTMVKRHTTLFITGGYNFNASCEVSR